MRTLHGIAEATGRALVAGALVMSWAAVAQQSGAPPPPSGDAPELAKKAQNPIAGLSARSLVRWWGSNRREPSP
jgi:hypothetical protein